MSKELSRRAALKNIVAGTAALGVSASIPAFALEQSKSSMLKGNVNHSVCRWCFGKMELDDLCIEAKKIGIKAIDLVGPKDWPTLKKHGLYSSMCNGAEINLVDGWNDPQFMPPLLKTIRR